jgi:Zn-dependent M16 (insulinase) family peptidase
MMHSPWIESSETPDLKESTIKTVEFPEEDESAGDILIAFLGPDCNDVVQIAALEVILTYLAGSSVSILENKMVEQEELASSIGNWWDARPKSVIWFNPTSVATEKLEAVERRFFEIIKEVAANPLDMKYIVECVKREKRQQKFNAESSIEYFSNSAINDFLFGKRDGSTLKCLETLDEYDVVEKWTDEQWRDFLRRWISDAKHVSILGKPSKTLSDKMKADELARVAAQKEKLGSEGLKNLAKKLEDAKAKNDAPIPSEVLDKWPVPGVGSIHFIETLTARAGLSRHLGVSDNLAQKVIDSTKDSPLFIQFEHVPSNFVYINVLLGTKNVPVELRPLISLFNDNFFNTPVMHEGQKVPFEVVVSDLEKDTISYNIDGGTRIGDSEGIVIQFRVEPSKYTRAIEWIKTLMFDSVFDETRLKAGLTKILADIPEAKRSGSGMLYGVDAMIHLAPESIYKARNTLVKGPYMKHMKKLLASEPAVVIGKLEELRKSLFTFNNMRILIIADVEQLEEPTTSWNPLLAELDTAAPLLPVEKQHQRLSAAGKNPGTLGTIVVPMPTSDSSFALASGSGPTSYTDPLIPALMVAVSYLDAVEGPLWRAVRGTGLAYGTGFSRDVDGGFMQFRVYRSPDAYKAFKASKEIVKSYIDGSAEFEKAALEGAVSAIVVGLADEQTTMASAAQLSFVNSVLRGLKDDYNSELLRKVREVSIDEIKAAMKEVLLPVFEPGTANVVVTCAPIMEEVSSSNSFVMVPKANDCRI